MRIEMKIRRLGKEGWREHIPETEDLEIVEKQMDAIVDKYGPHTFGSYQISYKINGGYSKNPETGSTMIINLKGQLNAIYDTLSQISTRDNKGE